MYQKIIKNYNVKPGQILAIPNDVRLLESSPTLNSPSTPPSWFRLVPKTSGSIRKCAGTIDYLSSGITVNMWTNATFRPQNDGKNWESKLDNYSFDSMGFVNQPFAFETTGKCPMTQIREIETGGYPKLVNPWCFVTAPGWSTMVLPPLFEPNNNYQVVPAIVHTDFYHNMNLVLNIITDKEFTIKYGTPVMHLIPFKRDSDFNELIIGKEEEYKYVTGRGFGYGSIVPTNGSAAPYRRERIKVDKELLNKKENYNIFNWIKNGFNKFFK